MLALQDGTNNTFWSSQSACLCDQGCYSYSVTDTGQVSIIDQYGDETWNSAGLPDMLQPAAGRPLQLLSSGRALSCIEGTAQRLLAPDTSAELRMSSAGRLELADTAGPVVWTAPGAAGAPAFKTCVQKDGMLRFTGSTGASVLWSSPAAGPAQPGPYVAMLVGPVVQVGGCGAVLGLIWYGALSPMVTVHWCCAAMSRIHWVFAVMPIAPGAV
jgi:hypothetical protein